MQTKLFSLFAAVAGFTSITSAIPLDTRQTDCSAYPWFIGPHYSADCSGTPPAYQPTSGPEQSTPQNVTCGTLYNPNTAPQAFGSVAVNRDPCPLQPWTINLYTDADCKTAPTTVASDICVPAPSGSAGWLKFDALYVGNGQ